jgi:hypothetical protein
MALSLESRVFLIGTSSRVVSFGLVQLDSIISQQSMNFKKKCMQAFQ